MSRIFVRPPLGCSRINLLHFAMLSSVAALTSSFTAPAGIVSSARSAVSPRMGVSDMCALWPVWRPN